MLCFRCGSYNPENAPKCSVCGQGFIDDAGNVVGPPRRVSPTVPPASVFVPGEVVASRYKIAELIGQGGVGAVYRARDTEIDVDVALKAITSNLLQTDDEQKNFSKQIKGARKLQHPNIVRVYDEGREGNRRFFTMKLLEGLTLRKIIRLRHDKGQAFSGEELVPIFQQLAAALDYAHKSTWHGDLKPENVIILPDLLKITDFNLVKALPLKPFLGIAKSRSKGFPYIAPELRVESTTIDGRVDIYALGVILAEMLTGLVFEGHYSRAITAALEALPTRLDALVRKAISEHPDARFAGAGELAAELASALAAISGPLPLPAKPPPLPSLGAGATGIPQARPLEPAALEAAIARVPGQPPPPPMETGPSHSPAPMVSSAPSGDERVSEQSAIDEIGQSQVLLLGSGAFTLEGLASPTQEPTTSALLADAARRLLAAGSNPDDTLDEPVRPAAGPPAREIIVEPRPRGEAAAFSDKLDAMLGSDTALAARIWAHESQEHDLIPPPIPDVEHSMDMPVQLSGDDEDEPTGETDVIAPRGLDDALPTDEMNAETPHEDSEIHDALTALKPHADDATDPGARAPERREPIVQPPRSRDIADEVTDKLMRGRNLPMRSEADDSLMDTVSVQELQEAKERSSPRLHRADALPPPVIGPALVLRPVTPPQRTAGGSNAPALGLILGIVLLALGILVWRFVLSDAPAQVADRSALDQAIVTPGDADEPIAASSSSSSTNAPATAAPIEKPEDPVVATKPPAPQPTTPTTPTTPVVVALASSSCPKGMALVEAGVFSFGSSAGDPMRNFGEADAAAADVAAYCVDYYEQPNGKDSLPTTGVSWQAAKSACDRLGRRLCSEKEWERACKGPSANRFPYGNTYDAEVCNTEDGEGNARALAPATSFKRCRSGYKAFMMAGNAEEWVLDSVNGQKIAKGGAADRPDFASRCSSRRSLAARTTAATLGYRCCADPS